MKTIKNILLSAFFMMLSIGVEAQCAMCKNVVKSDLDSGGDIANGINTGILYLMLIPYVILFIGGYFFFKQPIDAKLKEWKERYFSPKKA